ncbi:hypothetical protein PENSPDRAFT_655742 [Peniophora sp. CONT]|nr:hypothetical protein PENSPDRAFT_655742 [Peniophora sp. CONT]
MSEVVDNEPVPPILRLPDEVLYLIFHELWAIYPAGGGNKLGWTSSTFVCSRWRRVAIKDCAVLWGRSLCAFPKAFSTVVERAGDANLTINFGGSNHRSTEPVWLERAALREALIDIFRQRQQKIEHVCIKFPAYYVQALPLGLDDEVDPDFIDMGVVLNPDGGIAQDALPDPYAEVAAVNALAIAGGERASRFSSAVLSAFMGKSLPHLRHLELAYDMIACSVLSTALPNQITFSAPSLRSLKLFRQHIEAETLCDILHNSPLLETLAVQWAEGDCQHMFVGFPRRTEKLSLPYLVNASLGSRGLSLASCLTLWRLIDASDDARLHLLVSELPPPTENNPFVVLMPQLQRAGGDTLTIRWSFDGINLILSSSASTPSSPRSYVHMQFGDIPLPQPASGRLSSLLSQLFVLVDPARIRILNFEVAFSLSRGSVPELSRLTSVEELCVDMTPEWPLVGLGDLCAPGPDGASLFLALKTLVLKRINLTGLTRWTDEGRAVARTFLRQRKETGLPVSKLVLRGITFEMDLIFDDMYEGGAVRGFDAYVDEVVDRRRPFSDGISEIVADEDFL